MLGSLPERPSEGRSTILRRGGGEVSRTSYVSRSLVLSRPLLHGAAPTVVTTVWFLQRRQKDRQRSRSIQPWRPTEKYELLGRGKYSPETAAVGYIAYDSVKDTPWWAALSSRANSVALGLWSGHAG